MQERKTIESEKARSDVIKKAESTLEKQDVTEVKEAMDSVNQGMNVLGDNTEIIVSDKVTEEEKKGKASYNGTSTTGASSTFIANTALPTVDVMIEQTMLAIENELKVREDERKILIKDKDASFYQLSELTKRIRLLNNLLYQLKRAAKLAEDFIVGLWKQYVSKPVK